MGTTREQSVKSQSKLSTQPLNKSQPNTKSRWHLVGLSSALMLAVSAYPSAAHAGLIDNRDVQIRSIDFSASTLELHNFGSNDIDLTGWRFCSHDLDQQRVYSSSTGLNGVTIEAGTSVTIYFNNDAIVDADNINRSQVGAFAQPLDQDAFGIQLFFPDTNGSLSFGNSALIADHLQWNILGQSVGTAETRTAQAVSTGLWTATGAFIGTRNDSVRIDLTDNTNGRLHGPTDYAVTHPDYRDVQIRTIDFEAGTLELFNFGPNYINLAGWRFCSHDFDQQRQYTNPTGLDGVVIESNSSFTIHFNNDAPVSMDNVNRIQVGAFALPLDQDAFGIQLYFPDISGNVSFLNSDLIADHLQWNIEGQGAGQSETRTAQAVAAGLWTATGEFISTIATSLRIDLDDETNGRLHGPSDYTVMDPDVSLCGDSNCDGMVNVDDIDNFAIAALDGETAWNSATGAACSYDNNDINGDALVDGADLQAFTEAVITGVCPTP